MSRKKNPHSRWVAGNERFDKQTLEYLRRYREGFGWHQGARVRRQR